MEFFNRKEDVIDIKLTRYGKKKYSQGKLSPTYYAFFDDDIIYDYSYASMTETENSASLRIKDSVRPRIQNSFIGIESTLSRTGEQQTREKEYTYVSRLSNSDLGTNYAPSWKVTSHMGNINTVEQAILTGSVKTVTVPQLNMEDLVYTIKTVSEADENANLYGISYSDETALTVDFSNGEFLVGIEEKNTPLANDKFDIQIFEVSASLDEEEQLIPLRFQKRVSNIVNGLYVDVERVNLDDDDETYVENRFILETNSEIDRSFLQRAIGATGIITDQSELRTFGDSGRVETISDDASSRYVDGLTLDDIAGLSSEQIRQLRENQQDTSPALPSNEPPGECED